MDKVPFVRSLVFRTLKISCRPRFASGLILHNISAASSIRNSARGDTNFGVSNPPGSQYPQMTLVEPQTSEMLSANLPGRTLAKNFKKKSSLWKPQPSSAISGFSGSLWRFRATQRPLSSSFLGLPSRILNTKRKKELLRGLWVGVHGCFVSVASGLPWLGA